MRRVLRRASLLAYVSEAERQLAAPRFDAGPPVVITTNGVDGVDGVDLAFRAGPVNQPTGEHHRPADPPSSSATRADDLLVIGRLERYKNVHRLLAVADRLSPGARVRIAGGGPELDHLRSLAVASNRAVEVLGRVSDAEKRQLFATATIGVALSSHEAQGISVLEFLASGIPVVASDIPAHREIAERFGRVALVDPSSDESILGGIAEASAVGRGRPIRVPTWSDTADAAERAYEMILRGRGVEESPRRQLVAASSG
jgi:glycosyltransferase involved in cell wall biosynthesis